MELSNMIRERRLELGLGIRETARQTERPFVPHPIRSAVYLSRIENKIVEEMRAEAVSIDKLWAIGVALRLQPLAMFAVSRSMPELLDLVPNFALRDGVAGSFGEFLRNRRKELDFSMRTFIEEASRLSPWPISAPYLSQLETDFEGISERVQAEKLWSIGRVLNVDPLLLYVLSRKIDNRYLRYSFRNSLFT